MMTNITHINDATDETSPSTEEQRRILNNFLAKCSDLRKLERMLGRFNVFRVLRFEEGEIRHSNVLSWLFDPAESHGLDDTFIKQFLIRLKAEHPEEASVPDVIEIEAADIDEIEVRREWSDRATRDRLDLLLVIGLHDDTEWVVAVEVKVNAKQEDNQLLKYRNKVRNEHRQAARHIFVFLTRDQEEPDEEAEFLSADFRMVHDALKDCMDQRGSMLGAGPKGLMEEYLQLLETRFMPDSDIEKMARRIYREHREALDLILSYRQDHVQAISEKVQSDLPEKLTGLNYSVRKWLKGYVYLLPAAWDVPVNGNPKGTGYLHIEIDFYSGDTAWCRIVLEGGSQTLRSNVFKATETAKCNRKNKNQVSTQWAALHSEKLKVTLSEEESVGAAEAAENLIAKMIESLKAPEMQNRIMEFSKALNATPVEVKT